MSVQGRSVIGRANVWPWLAGVLYVLAGAVFIVAGEWLFGLLEERAVRGMPSVSGLGWLFLAATAPVAVYGVRRIQRNRSRGRHQYESIVQHSLDGVLLTAPDGTVLSANPAACEILGYSEAELRAGGRSLLLDEADPEVRALLAERKLEGRVRGELWAKRKDGSRVRVELSSAIFSEAGRDLSAISFHDITERLVARYREVLSDAVFSAASEGIALLDSEWRLAWVNSAFERLSGLEAEDAVGRFSPFYCELRKEPDRLRAFIDTLERDGRWVGEVLSRRANGELYPLRGTVVRIDSAVMGEPHYVGTFTDLSQLRDYERQLSFASRYDTVTQLQNRFAFEERFEESLARSDPAREVAALLLLNIDNFKDVNESLGHACGDACLREVGERLRRVRGEDGFVARHSGDSFFVAVTGLENLQDSALVARRVRSAFDEPINIEGTQVALSASMGISTFPNDGRTVDSLMRAAETALAEAKAEGGDDYRYYATGSEARAREFVSKAAQIREGLQRGEFVAFYQPVVDYHSGRMTKVEVLARWEHPSRGLLAPGEFIGVAERAGLIGELSEVLLSQAVRSLARLDAAGLQGLSLTVNLSARQFRDPKMVDRLHRIVTDASVAPRRVIFELTESLMMHNAEAKRRVVQALKNHGYRIFIDDFGTGYSSLSYLRQFSVDGVKIDKSFIAGLPGDKTNAALVRTIIAVARELDLLVIAEGIEEREQAQYLASQGCHQLQGYYFARPMAAEDLVRRFAGDETGAADRAQHDS